MRWVRQDGERPPSEAARRTVVNESAWLARILEEDPDPVFRVSAEHVLLYSNPAGKKLCRRWGCRLGQKMPASIHAAVSTALTGGAPLRREVAFASHIYALTIMPSVADGYVNIYARDITNCKRMEDELRQHAAQVEELVQARTAELEESEDRYRILLEHGFDGIFVHEDFRVVQLNDRLAEMTGYTRAELMGSRAFDLLTPESQERIRHHATSGATGYFDIQLCRRDGQLVDVEAYGASCRFQGRPARIVGLRDITERKRAQAALQESEEKFRSLAETSPAAILIYQDGRYVYANPAIESITGYTSTEFLPQAPEDIIHPDYREQVKQMISRRAQGEGPPMHYELKVLTKDGRERWMDSTTVSIAYRNKPAGLVVAFDITERKRAEEALRNLNEQLELQVAQRTEELRHTVNRLRQLTLDLSQAEDRERRRIAHILHEDVQQTLAGARFYANLLDRETRNTEESREIVEQIKHLLREAIEKSRNLSHELSPAIYQVELLDILRWLARHMKQKHGLTVRVDVHGPVESPSEPLKVFLFRVAQELLFNVVKHAGVNEARICVRRRGPYLYLSVVDRGRGFDPRNLEGATGFGLLSIRERVRLLGGQIRIRSAPGAGGRLLIAVPYETPALVLGPTEGQSGQTDPERPAQSQPTGWLPPSQGRIDGT